jgi:hypothetical protein
MSKKSQVPYESRRRLYLLGILMALSSFPTAGCQPLNVEKERPMATISVAVKKPSTLVELLENIKISIDHGVLLREDFYTDENLTRYFGSNEVFWFNTDDPRKKSGALDDFGAMVHPLALAHMTLSGLTFRLWRERLENGNVSVDLHLSILSNNPVSFDDVVKIFGSSGGSQPMRIGPHETPRPTSKPHGNEDLGYHIRKGLVDYTLQIRFRFDATIEFASFSVVGRI